MITKHVFDWAKFYLKKIVCIFSRCMLVSCFRRYSALHTLPPLLIFPRLFNKSNVFQILTVVNYIYIYYIYIYSLSVSSSSQSDKFVHFIFLRIKKYGCYQHLIFCLGNIHKNDNSNHEKQLHYGLLETKVLVRLHWLLTAQQCS